MCSRFEADCIGRLIVEESEMISMRLQVSPLPRGHSLQFSIQVSEAGQELPSAWAKLAAKKARREE